MDKVISEKAYFLSIDGALLREQRAVLNEILSASAKLTNRERGALEGIRNLLDSVADQACDIHGIDCLEPVPPAERLVSCPICGADLIKKQSVVRQYTSKSPEKFDDVYALGHYGAEGYFESDSTVHLEHHDLCAGSDVCAECGAVLR